MKFVLNAWMINIILKHLINVKSVHKEAIVILKTSEFNKVIGELITQQMLLFHVILM